ncbi:hypothetical protein [Tepidibacter thalassicus]|uniref:Uncharacterized protein n=1 Tax=Tepidibacter thalassicus DSM 15285 TaxID=1123350 RepID=A0A1M5PXA9_9FIRM|nr:hypothetical protein [Tepidibacter thalassicus]SHH06434.1 hypothetical protein SAMN02744040_00659 [Tepidibacter thalassicus DSM 15285]
MNVNRIKKVTVVPPAKENLEEFERRKAQAFIRILKNKYPLEVLDEVFKKLEDELNKNRKEV